jgi:integrase
MSVYERKGYWYIEVSLPNGKLLKRSVGKKGIVTKAVARQVEQELKRKVKLGQWDLMRETPTFSDFISDFISYLKEVKQNRAWDQAEFCVQDFAKFFGAKKLSEISSSDIEDYKRLKTKEVNKPASINKDLPFVRHLFNYAKRCNKFFANNPVSISGLLPVNNQKTRILTPEEETLVLDNSEEPLKSMIQLALLGLRLNSIRTLKWHCVDFSANTITIDAVYSKNKRTQTIPINTTVRTVLLEAKLRCGNSEYVFPEFIKLAKSGIRSRFRKLCVKLGIKGLSFHCLRHTCGTRLAEIGYDISTISKMLGHSSPIMSMRYVHPKDVLRRAVEDLDKYTNSTTKITITEEMKQSN